MKRIYVHSGATLSGILEIEEFIAQEGQLIASRRWKQKNLCVAAGRNLVRDALYGDTVAGISHLALGTGSTIVAASDTALVTEAFRDAVTQKTKAAGQLVIKYFLGQGSANGSTLAEAGLLNAASGGTLFARTVLAETIAKTASKAYTFTWTITIAGS